MTQPFRGAARARHARIGRVRSHRVQFTLCFGLWCLICTGLVSAQDNPSPAAGNDVGEHGGIDQGKPPVIRRLPWVEGHDLLENREGISSRRVRVEVCEANAGTGAEWPASPPVATEHWYESAFGLVELPFRYVDTGVRGDREPAFFVRLAGYVTLPAGRHRFLIRGRGATALHVGGETVLTTPFPSPDNDGHAPVRTRESWLDLTPEFHFAPPGVREAWCSRECEAGTYLVVLESVVGGALGKSRRRPDLGELTASISLEGEAEFRLLSPDGRERRYTEAGWLKYATAAYQKLQQANAERRAAAREKSKPYWDRRRQLASEWLASSEEIAVPTPSVEYEVGPHPVDRFLASDLARTLAGDQKVAGRDAIDFHRDVKPILDAHCLECHRGARAKRGFRLDVARFALGPTDSGESAILPGQPDDSELLVRINATDETRMPPPSVERGLLAKGGPALRPPGARPAASSPHGDASASQTNVSPGLSQGERDVLTRWIREGATWPKEPSASRTPLAQVDDATFLRRVYLDIVGVPPSPDEWARFHAAPVETRRELVIDRLLADGRWVDNWMGFWQDLLAENPNILNPTLNNTGPFRWWLKESLEDDKPLDLMVTELVRMKGSERSGGPAGFGVASQNDVPAASKGVILAGTFLGIDMKCARCHDSPTHESNQKELFQLAGMLSGKSIKVPETSSVPADKLHTAGRVPLIRVTLKPGTEVAPAWPFDSLISGASADRQSEHPEDPRDRLASLLTSPANTRFAEVFVNRVWHRYLGRGLVEPVHDWEVADTVHPELLKWLAREFVRGGYRVKPLARLIVTSRAYARKSVPTRTQPDIWHTVGTTRRMSAEQVVDSMFAVTGKTIDVEEFSLDTDVQRDIGNSITLGKPSRAWMFGSTSNERDRPSLNLPRIMAVVDLMEAFGWKGARPEPINARDNAATPSQPAMVANSTVATWVTRLTDNAAVTDLACQDQTVEQFVNKLFLRILSRPPREDERQTYADYLASGYRQRLRAFTSVPPKRNLPRPYVTWTNHLDPEATRIRQEEEKSARAGDPPTDKLDPGWRERAEDVVWSLLNAPEWVFIP